MAHAVKKNKRLRHDRFPHPRSPSVGTTAIPLGCQKTATKWLVIP
jgi:hypothetical protein